MVISLIGKTSNKFIKMCLLFLESVGFELESCCLFEAEQEVHILDGLTGGSFQQIVKRRVNDQLASHLFHLYQAFIGVDHLFQGNRIAADDGERVAAVEIFV